MAYDCVNEVNVYSCVGHPLKSDMKNIANWLLNDAFADAFSSNYLIGIEICGKMSVCRDNNVEKR